MKIDYSEVTEVSDEKVSYAQIERLIQRYIWAGKICSGLDVLEIACGSGQGLGYLASVSKSIIAGDITNELVDKARAHYGNRIKVSVMDAHALPFQDKTLDVIIIFEALYYLPDVSHFVHECRRVLRSGGLILIATANKDLYDFNPSPFSISYYNPPELQDMLSSHGFDSQFFGGVAVNSRSIKIRVLRLIKKIAVTLNLIPLSMRGKQWLKRLVFGKLVTMPRELKGDEAPYIPPVSINGNQPDVTHQVLYCIAKK